jgi:hypothetical protein
LAKGILEKIRKNFGTAETTNAWDWVPFQSIRLSSWIFRNSEESALEFLNEIVISGKSVVGRVYLLKLTK